MKKKINKVTKTFNLSIYSDLFVCLICLKSIKILITSKPFSVMNWIKCNIIDGIVHDIDNETIWPHEPKRDV